VPNPAGDISRKVVTSPKSRAITTRHEQESMRLHGGDDFGVPIKTDELEGRCTAAVVQGIGQALLEVDGNDNDSGSFLRGTLGLTPCRG